MVEMIGTMLVGFTVAGITGGATYLIWRYVTGGP